MKSRYDNTTSEEKQKSVAYNMRYDSLFLHLDSYHKPNLEDTTIAPYAFSSLLFFFALIISGLSYWSARRSTKDYFEYNGDTGELKFVCHHLFSPDEEHYRVIDIIPAITLRKNRYSRDLNVGELEIYINYITDGVNNFDFRIKYCDDLVETADKIQQFMMKCGKDAAKVQFVN